MVDDMDPHLAVTPQPNKYLVLLLQAFSLLFFLPEVKMFWVQVWPRYFSQLVASPV